MKQKAEARQEQNQIRKLEMLLEVVRLCSIRKAAGRLSYTQSGLTYLLNTIEADRLIGAAAEKIRVGTVHSIANR